MCGVTVKELCRALFAYQRQNDDELTLKEGDIVTIVSKESDDKGWWRGELAGKIGVFPDNFVEVISSAEVRSDSMLYSVGLRSDSGEYSPSLVKFTVLTPC